MKEGSPFLSGGCNMNLGVYKCPSWTCDDTIQASYPHYYLNSKAFPFYFHI